MIKRYINLRYFTLLQTADSLSYTTNAAKIVELLKHSKLFMSKDEKKLQTEST